MRKVLIIAVLALAGVALAASPASAAQQRGLVNVNVEDVLIQVPVSVAANVCDVTVVALAQQIGEGPTSCESEAESMAISTPTQGRGAHQEGLVNVNLDDITVLVPIAVAANVCDVTVAVLSTALLEGPTTCDALAESTTG
jgi:hypothetical protein